MNQTLDYYAVLQLKFGAAKPDIVSSYRRLSKIYHPDINHEPGAEETMKQINIAYSFLCDDIKREAYNRLNNPRRSVSYSPDAIRKEQARRDAEDKEALNAVESYFYAILSGAYENAYSFISDFDKQYVTKLSFCEWRKSVRKLFGMREFTVKNSEDVSSISLKDGVYVRAKRHFISIDEKNLMTQETECYQVAKHTVCEHGKWHVLLGYRDLNEIAKVFENLSVEQEKSEMEKHWEQFCLDTCRELDMLSLSGLIKESERELYRFRRYNQSITIACFKLLPLDPLLKGEITPDLLDSAARTIQAALRETDIPAYIGDGIFAVLFVEMKKRYMRVITQRLSDKLKLDAADNLKIKIDVLSKCSHYTGGSLKSYIDLFINSLK